MSAKDVGIRLAIFCGVALMVAFGACKLGPGAVPVDPTYPDPPPFGSVADAGRDAR